MKQEVVPAAHQRGQPRERLWESPTFRSGRMSIHSRESDNNQNDDEDRERDTKAPNGDSAANHFRFSVLLCVGLIPFLAVHAIPRFDKQL
jgi:hypothetical protein